MTNFTMLARDRPTLTKQALLSLNAAQGAKMNVTLLDDRSQPETAGILKDWAMAHQAHLVRNEQAAGTGALRNAVIEVSQRAYGRGEWLYLSDNDVSFKSDWLWHLTYYYERIWDAGFRVLGAYNHPFHQPVHWRYMSDGYAIQEVTALATQSWLMRWEVWDKYGPFCETPVDKVCQSEDVDFTNRIRADGFKLGVVAPALVVSTGITNTFGEKIPGWQAVQAQAPSGVIVQ